MADWVDELERRKRKEQQQHEAEKAESRQRYEAAHAKHVANYELHKSTLHHIFHELIKTVERANSLTNTRLNWLRTFDHELIVSNAPEFAVRRTNWDPRNYRYMQIGFFDSHVT